MRKSRNKVNKQNPISVKDIPIEPVATATAVAVDTTPKETSPSVSEVAPPTPINNFSSSDIDFVKITKIKEIIKNMNLDIDPDTVATLFKHPPLKSGYNVLRTVGLASVQGAKFGMTRTRADGSPRSHQGIDLAVPPGYRCYAVADGVVRGINKVNDNGYGLSVTIKIADSLFVFYAHLSRIYVKVGDRVKAGDIIGLTGYSGNARNMRTMETGSHLHFEVRTKVAPGGGLNNRLDPLAFFDPDTYDESLYA